MAVLVGWGFKKPLDGAGAWKEELKPPGFVFSLVFPNENAGAAAGLGGWLDGAGAPKLVVVELPKDGAAGAGATKPDSAGAAPNVGAAGAGAGVAPNAGGAGVGAADVAPKDGAGAAEVAVEAPNDGAAGVGAEGAAPKDGGAELVAGAGAAPNLNAP